MYGIAVYLSLFGPFSVHESREESSDLSIHPAQVIAIA